MTIARNGVLNGLNNRDTIILEVMTIEKGFAPALCLTRAELMTGVELPS
jgi:hypothetical protein